MTFSLTEKILIYKNINLPIYHQIPQETSKIKKTSKDDVIPSDIANDIANGLNITNNNNAYITVKKDLLNNQGIIHSV